MSDGIIINADEDIVSMFGEAKRFLNFADGYSSFNVSKLILKDLVSLPSTALYRVKIENQAVAFKNIPLVLDNKQERIDFYLKPIFDQNSKRIRFYILTFKLLSFREEENSRLLTYDVRNHSKEMFHELESQLASTRLRLNSILQDSEMTKEELQSTNEELQASNEELQSTNEELHSVNEELYTVNSEYQKKIEELIQLEDDIDRLLQTTNIGTIFVDSEIRIRKITPAISDSFSILNSDIGRPLETFIHKFGHSHLIAEIKNALDDKSEKILEPKQYNEKWMVLKIMPYFRKTVINGAVLTFIDMTSIKEMETSIEAKDQTIALRAHEFDDFAYFSAHDLKGILRAHQNHIENLEKHLNQFKIDAPEISHLKNDHKVLNRIADSLSMFSDLGKKSYISVKTDLEDLITRLKEDYSGRKDVSISSDTDIGSVTCDPDSIRYILSELTKNGVIFNSSETKQIHIGRLYENPNEDVVYVRDNGIGIRKEDLDRVFNMFKKLSRTDDFERGHGVGLSFCKRHLEKIGGRLKIESEPQKGTTAYIVLPNS
ncbi:MAG: PAS domain-containing protein [Pseudobacteriovorax sp.]|nr:PAS domain-containing protein [Pseudobacteriovorax sp.]